MTQTKEAFFTNLLISIHTARWTGNGDSFRAYMDAIAAYSYAHTNSNFYDEEDKIDKAHDRFVEQCKQISEGNYRKTTPEYVAMKQQLRIPFPDYDYNKFEPRKQ